MLIGKYGTLVRKEGPCSEKLWLQMKHYREMTFYMRKRSRLQTAVLPTSKLNACSKIRTRSATLILLISHAKLEERLADYIHLFIWKIYIALPQKPTWR